MYSLVPSLMEMISCHWLQDLSSTEKEQRKSRLFSKDWFQELEKYEAGMLLVKMLMDMVTSSLHILSKLIIICCSFVFKRSRVRNKRESAV